MSQRKKQRRRQFRDAVFHRDRHQCVTCHNTHDLDAHHITDRHDMPHGGYVKENGISLCPVCHLEAENFHQGLPVRDGFHPEQLYEKIGSSHGQAVQASRQMLTKIHLY